jgi:hypothetical protein
MGTHSVVPESNDDASPFRFLFNRLQECHSWITGYLRRDPGELLHLPFNLHFRMFR